MVTDHQGDHIVPATLIPKLTNATVNNNAFTIYASSIYSVFVVEPDSQSRILH